MQAILQIASQQGGVVRRDQALAAGVTGNMIRRRISIGEWTTVGASGYRIFNSSGRLNLMRAAVAVLPDAVASHYSAAAIHVMPLVPRDIVSVTVHSKTTHEFPGVRVFRSLDLTPDHLEESNGLPVTTVARTAVDIAACLSLKHLEVVVDELLASNRCEVAEMRAMLDSVARRGRRGVANMRVVIDDRSERLPDATVLEQRGHDLLVNSGFSDFLVEYPIPWSDGRRFDIAFPGQRVAIEWDSRRWHTQKVAFQNDRERDRDAHTHGWRVLRFTWDDVCKRPADTIATIRSVVGR